MYRDIPDELRVLLEPVVEGHGFELVDVEVKRSSSQGLLRVTIDNPSGDGRVPVDACAAVSRELSTALDAADEMPGTYRLEVSSPGLDRLLAREKDFAGANGEIVKLTTRWPVQGRKQFKGCLKAFDGQIATVEVDGREYGIPFEDVERANRVYQFEPADFQTGAQTAERASARREPGSGGSDATNERPGRGGERGRRAARPHGRKSKGKIAKDAANVAGDEAQGNGAPPRSDGEVG